MTNNPIRIAIVNDVAISRLRLRRLISACEWMTVVAEGSDGLDAVDLRFSADPPDLLVVNGQMRRISGPDAIAWIRSRERNEGLPRMPIVLESVDVHYHLDGRKSGADATCGRGGTTDDLLSAIAWAWHSTRPQGSEESSVTAREPSVLDVQR